MSKGSHRAHPEQPRASHYEEVTARIVADLEAGTFPWAQPCGAGPQNATLGFGLYPINCRPQPVGS
jgi:antirestriction protein ArdC